MSRKDFIDAHKHLLAGFVLDAIAAGRDRQGAELALWIRNVMQRIDAHCGVMFDALAPSALGAIPMRKAGS